MLRCFPHATNGTLIGCVSNSRPAGYKEANYHQKAFSAPMIRNLKRNKWAEVTWSETPTNPFPNQQFINSGGLHAVAFYVKCVIVE